MALSQQSYFNNMMTAEDTLPGAEPKKKTIRKKAPPAPKAAEIKKAAPKKAAAKKVSAAKKTAKPAALKVAKIAKPVKALTETTTKKPTAKKAQAKSAKPAKMPAPVVAEQDELFVERAAPIASPVAPMVPPAPLREVAEANDWKPSSSAVPAGAPQQASQQAHRQAQQSTPQQTVGGQKPRPLYIPREVEAFLRAANIPVPTEKAQLDAILGAMQTARTVVLRAAGQTAMPPAEGVSAAPQQHQQNRPQHQQQPQRHQRDGRDNRGNRDNRDNRGNRDNRAPREYSPQQPQQHPQHQQQPPQEPRPEEPSEIVEAEGYCEISGKGFGFLRDPKRYFQPNPADIFVTPEAVKKYGLRDGHWLKVEARKNSRGLQINRVLAINDQPPENAKTWPSFDDLTTINPIEHIPLETDSDRYTTRIIDLMTPVGKGQRGLIVAPPRTGKTTLLNHIAGAVIKNHPNIKLIILLVDERPEEVTDFKCNVPQAELWASSNDMEIKSHTRIAQLCIERAKRLVESGADVFILLDSITRLGRAFNNAISGGGRTMSGGVDSRALEIPRKIFAAARNSEEAGSLTIVATALVETGSRMDDLIFQEFKGTGNMEIVLDRKISDLRIYPAIDIFQSGTRREELILPADNLQKIAVIRRGLSGHKPIEAIERMLSFVKRFPTNGQLLREIPG